MLRHPPISPIFPYTTLFRCRSRRRAARASLAASCRAMARRTASERLAIERQLAAKRSEEHTSELQSLTKLVCRLLLEKKNNVSDTHQDENMRDDPITTCEHR